MPSLTLSSSIVPSLKFSSPPVTSARVIVPPKIFALTEYLSVRLSTVLSGNSQPAVVYDNTADITAGEVDGAVVYIDIARFMIRDMRRAAVQRETVIGFAAGYGKRSAVKRYTRYYTGFKLRTVGYRQIAFGGNISVVVSCADVEFAAFEIVTVKLEGYLLCDDSPFCERTEISYYIYLNILSRLCGKLVCSCECRRKLGEHFVSYALQSPVRRRYCTFRQR